MSMVVTIEDELVSALEAFGGLQEATSIALRRYAVEIIGDKIASLRAKDKEWEEKYGCDSFVERISNDLEFVTKLHREHPIWEADLIDWEFCHEGVKDWTQELEKILGS
ncbi:MAG: hypothetical protein HWN51_06285 [Desulfobacterales bacterium]|nr:hypothetical protein [Desulfobacterales bacterium]